MARTTYEAVVKLVEVDPVVSADLEPFIETATALVDSCCLESDYSDSRLELIERWLAAHFYTIRDNRVANETADGVGAGYQYKIGYMLANSMQGQTAMMMDTDGNLAALSKQLEEGKRPFTPGVSHLGMTPSEINEENS